MECCVALVQVYHALIQGLHDPFVALFPQLWRVHNATSLETSQN